MSYETEHSRQAAVLEASERLERTRRLTLRRVLDEERRRSAAQATSSLAAVLCLGEAGAATGRTPR